MTLATLAARERVSNVRSIPCRLRPWPLPRLGHGPCRDWATAPAEIGPWPLPRLGHGPCRGWATAPAEIGPRPLPRLGHGLPRLCHGPCRNWVDTTQCAPKIPYSDFESFADFVGELQNNLAQNDEWADKVSPTVAVVKSVFFRC